MIHTHTHHEQSLASVSHLVSHLDNVGVDFYGSIHAPDEVQVVVVVYVLVVDEVARAIEQRN